MVIYIFNWLHYLNYETIALSSSNFISSYGECHMGIPSHPTDGVTYFPVFSPSLVCTGIILWLEHCILWMV